MTGPIFSQAFADRMCAKLALQPDIDICAECGDHAEFEETDDGCVSNCCGAGAYDTDPDLDLER
jgi:hypothetical protein